MKYFKVTFADGNSITTGMNATLAEAEEYYVGTRFNFGDTFEHPKDKMVEALKVEELT
jgi:hypothetical protein